MADDRQQDTGNVPDSSNRDVDTASQATPKDVETNLREMSIRANKRIDDILLKVPGGAVGLSIAYTWQQTSSSGTEPAWRGILVASWMLWIASFLCAVWSQVMSRRSAEEAWLRFRRQQPTKGGKAERWTTRLEAGALGTFTLAAVMTVVFFALNFGGF